MLATVRSHDQFNTSIYSNNDRYRGLSGLRTLVFMNEQDMRERDLDEFDLVDITSTSKDGSKRTVYGYRAVKHDVPPGNTVGYMPERAGMLVSFGSVRSCAGSATRTAG
jgi:anaerobic selenocysteine-containing dehydrogenase